MRKAILRGGVGVFCFTFIFLKVIYAETYTVKKVIEGDIFELSNGEIVYLIGIDAPDSRPTPRAKVFAERSGKKLKDILAVGKKAQKFVQQLIEGREVRLEFDRIERDKNGALWAYVYDVVSYKKSEGFEVPRGHFLIGDEIFVNATIVKSGYASPLIIPPNVKYTRLFKQLFNEARINRRGLWQ